MVRFLLLCLMAGLLVACGGGGSGKFYSADKTFGYYKVGNPYKIKGVLYKPRVDYNYSRVGIASWYGKAFHGKRTANGAIFDMNKISAAHRTLPLPSYVMVHNLENGKKLKVLVNDRGPFYNNRIIDLSREAAKELGVYSRGTARVRVTILAEESSLLATRMQTNKIKQAEVKDKSILAKAAPAGTLKFEDLPPIDDNSSFISSANAATTDEDIEVINPAHKIYIQIGAYSNYANAIKVRLRMRSIGNVELWQTQNEPPLFRVRMGPFDNVNQAENNLAKVAEKGYKDAQIVIVKGDS